MRMRQVEPRLPIVALTDGDFLPQNGKVGDPDFVPYTTPALVAEAHRAGWTRGYPPVDEKCM